MTKMPSFTEALPLYLLAITAATLLIQVLDISLKSDTPLQNFKCGKAYARLLSWIIYLVSLSGAILAWLTSAKIHMLYVFYVLAPLIPATLLLFQWRCGEIPIAIASLLLWYFMIEVPPAPRDLLFIVENVHMARTMVFHGAWIPEKAHNAAYALFPTTAFVQTTLSLITGIPWYSYLAITPIFIAWAISLGITVHLFVRTINPESSNEKLLPLVLLALTPQVYLFGHAYQIPAMIMWLISVTFFTRFANKSRSLSDAFLSILVFVAAVITHPSSIVALGYIFVYFFVIKFLSRQFKFVSTELKNFDKHVLTFLAAFSAIFVIRAVYDIWYSAYVLRIGLGGVYNLIDFIFGYETPSKASASIYDVSGIPFHQAYTWALVTGLALGKVLCDLAFRRSVNPNELSGVLTAMIFAGLGFTWGALVRGVSSQLYRSAYVSFVFFIPAATALSPRLRSSVARYILLLIIVVGTITILTDPEVSLVGSLRSRGVPLSIVDIQSSPSDIIQAFIIVDRVGDLNILNHMGLYSPIQLEYVRITAYGKTIPQIYNPLADAIYKVLYIRGFTKGDSPEYTPYIVAQTQLNAVRHSVVYNSFKYYCLI